MNGHITNLDTIHRCNDYLHVESYHPLVSVIDLNDIDAIQHTAKHFGVYGITCNCDRNIITDSGINEIFASMHFIAPNTNGKYSHGSTYNPKGWLLLFHPDLMKNTMLMNSMSEFSFFNHTPHAVIYLTKDERDMVVNCMKSIYTETRQPIDKHTNNIIISGIAVLLCLCQRYYDRQFNSISSSRGVIARLDRLLNTQLHTIATKGDSLPTVAWCAKNFNLTANYFGDLIKRHTGISAQEYIQRRIINEAKILMVTNKLNISEISYRLGFKYPHHLTRIFKRIEGCTPNQFKKLNMDKASQ